MIILDSSFLIAFHNSNDVHHRSACDIMDRLLSGEWGKSILIEYVFLEVTTVLLARRNLETATSFGMHILQAAEVEFVACTEYFMETFEEFKKLFESGAIEIS